MSDLIDRHAAIDAIEEYADRLQIVDWKENPGVPYKAYALNWCINTIRDLPSAQPERKKGKWEVFYPDHKYKYHCSECGAYHRAMYDFCPSCGARMEV